LLTSCDPAVTAGLQQLVEKWHSQVVAAPEGFETLTQLCPGGTALVSAWELAERGWFSLKPISLQGRAGEAIAYQLTWDGKIVLFSGSIPTKVNHDSQRSLVSDLTSPPKGDLRGYFDSMIRLQNVHPDVWLPSIPVDGQNANLYDKDWERTIEDNLYIISILLSPRQNGQ